MFCNNCGQFLLIASETAFLKSRFLKIWISFEKFVLFYYSFPQDRHFDSLPFQSIVHFRRNVFLKTLKSCWTKRTELRELLGFLKFQIFVTKCFKTTLNLAVQLVSHSIWQLFFVIKKLSHIKFWFFYKIDLFFLENRFIAMFFLKRSHC